MFILQPFIPSKAYATRTTQAKGDLGFALLIANASLFKALMYTPKD